MHHETNFTEYLTVLHHQLWSPVPRKLRKLENGKFCQVNIPQFEEQFGLQKKVEHEFHNPKNSAFRYLIIICLHTYAIFNSKMLFNEDTSDQSYGNKSSKDHSVSNNSSSNHDDEEDSGIIK